MERGGEGELDELHAGRKRGAHSNRQACDITYWLHAHYLLVACTLLTGCMHVTYWLHAHYLLVACTLLQLHHALFGRTGAAGYVLKPAEMRSVAPNWPPERPALARASLELLSLSALPKPREARPYLAGAHEASHRFCPQLSGSVAPPDASAVASPVVRLQLHSLGSFACVSSDAVPLGKVATAWRSSACNA